MAGAAPGAGVRKVPVFTVDAFTSAPFSGNPCAVVLVPPEGIDDATMQAIAAEMNLSETAFVTPRPGQGHGGADGGSDDTDRFRSATAFHLRWFTPTCEVPLCGHGTMAAAAAVAHVGNAHPSIVFDTLSGPLAVRMDAGGAVSMDLPRNAPVDEDASAHAGVIGIATCGELAVARVRHSAATKKLLVQLADDTTREALEAIRPDTVAMARAHDGSVYRGVILTTKGEGKPGGYDFISRYFAPWNGIPEDPVTGSAHTVLAPHWAAVLGRTELRARQCSPRGGDLGLAVTDDAVTVSGTAAIVLEGVLRLPAAE